MSGLQFDYTLNMLGTQQLFNRLERADQTLLLGEIGEQLLQATLMRFDAEETPDGDKWEPSYRATAEGGKTLQDRGHLRDSYVYQVGGDYVEIGSDMIYAAIHHFGGLIKPKQPGGKLKFKVGDRFAQVDQVEIPARPALGLNDNDAGDIDEIVRDFYQELINGH